MTGGSFLYAKSLFDPVSASGTPVRVEIPPGAAAAEIGRRLRKAGVIRSALVFQVTARLLGESGNMKAGDYLISPNLGVIPVLQKLVAGDAEAQWVVIPEGLTVRQVAKLLESRRLGSVSRFLRAAGRPPQAYGLMVGAPRSSLEGYLMPDTYRFPRHLRETELIRVMLENWNAKVLRPNRERFAKSDLPIDKVVTIAAMIEREARLPGDRPLIASVVRNRLRRKMPLQIDATVLYALGKHKTVVTLEDLKVESPYNTYRRVGLPPGPICSPGAASIQAALVPSRTDYLYYVARPDGRHIFSHTAAEHEAAVAQARKLAGG